MKKSLILILLIFSSFHVFSQNNNQLFEMINVSMMKYIEIQEGYANEGIIRPLDFSKIYLLTDNYPLNFEFSAEIRDKGFQFVSLKSYRKSFFKTSKHVIAFMGPIIEGDIIKITFSDWSVSFKNNNLNIGVGSGWVTSSWRYSNSTEKWELSSVTPGGI